MLRREKKGREGRKDLERDLQRGEASVKITRSGKKRTRGKRTEREWNRKGKEGKERL